MADLELEEIVSFVRDVCDIPARKVILNTTRIEEDLGVSGDDADDLLRAACERFGVSEDSLGEELRRAFDLEQNQTLFTPEGFDLLGISCLIRWLRGVPQSKARDCTIQELRDVLEDARDSQSE